MMGVGTPAEEPTTPIQEASPPVAKRSDPLDETAELFRRVFKGEIVP